MPNNYFAPPIDNELVFSSGQTVTADAASTNFIDFKAANCFGKNVKLCVRATGIGAGESIQMKLQMDDNSSFSSATDVWTSASLTSDQTDYQLIDLSNDMVTERYVRMYYDVSTADSIDVTAFLAPGG